MKRSILLLYVTAVVGMAVVLSPAGAGGATWYVGPGGSIQAAVNGASPGDTIVVSGEYVGDGATVNKPVTITASWTDLITGKRPRINDGPEAYPGWYRTGFRIDPDGSGAKIIDFMFDCGQVLTFGVFSFGADDVSITGNTINGSAQAVTNWHGSNWKIINNRINETETLGGAGGIGILIGSFRGGPAEKNVVIANRISGSADDDIIYSRPAIALVSDARSGSPGGPVKKNLIAGNSCKSTGKYGVGVELSQLTAGSNAGDVSDNVLVCNICAYCAYGITLYSAGSDNFVGWDFRLDDLVAGVLENKISDEDTQRILSLVGNLGTIGNWIHHSQQDGIWAGSPLERGCFGNHVIGNLVQGSGANGIFMDLGSYGNEIRRNMVSGSGGCDRKDLGEANSWDAKPCGPAPKSGRKLYGRRGMTPSEEIEPVVLAHPLR
jgi:hypothetical protein